MTPKRPIGRTDLYLRLGVNTQAWREFCRAEQLLASRDELLAALQQIVALSDDHGHGFVAGEIARAAIAKASQE
jgi:hypothetical protein